MFLTEERTKGSNGRDEGRGTVDGADDELDVLPVRVAVPVVVVLGHLEMDAAGAEQDRDVLARRVHEGQGLDRVERDGYLQRNEVQDLSEA